MRGGLALAVLLALGGCGLQPVYSGGSRGVAATTLAGIALAPIPDRAGYLMTQALRERLGEPAGPPRYRLEVELQDEIFGFGVRGDNSIARERRTLSARYRLVAVGSGAVVFDATTTSDVGIDRVSSDYAVVAAETTALDRLTIVLADRMTARIARFAQSGRMAAGDAAADKPPTP